MSEKNSKPGPVRITPADGIVRTSGEPAPKGERRYSTMPPAPIPGGDITLKLARCMAHQMNNVLASIMGLASVLESELDPGSPHSQDVNKIISATREGLSLTRNLMAFAGGQQVRKQRISLNHLIGICRSLLLQSTSSEFNVDLHLANDLAEIEGDESQLKQILVQLGMNAADAIRNRGMVTFSTRNVVLDAPEASIAGLNPGRYVQLLVSDTGQGMDSITLEHAFEPLFSTKSVEKLAGFGLPTVARIIDEHGGAISIYSRKGLGTTATIYLPALDELDERATWTPEQDEQNRAMAATTTAMLVDDETLTRGATRRVLERMGYSVLEANTGMKALKIYDEKKRDISVVLLDLIMPDMDGAEVARRLKGMNPQVRIVICSGYPQESAATTYGATAFLSKPFTVQQLAAVIDEVNDTPAS